jgi:hypothetical protein
MLEIAHAKTEVPPRQDQLIQMATAHWMSRILYVAAKMNLAERLAEGPRTAKELAQSTATDVPSLYRLMRALASLGLFTEGPSHRFSLTPLGEAFRTGTVRAIGRRLVDEVTRTAAVFGSDREERLRESLRHAVF